MRAGSQLKQYKPGEKAETKELRLKLTERRVYLVDRFTGREIAQLGWFDVDGWNASDEARQKVESAGYLWPFIAASLTGAVPTFSF